MNILAIETSCDETALAILGITDVETVVHNSVLASQTQTHAPYGGVFPSLAKREHGANMPKLLTKLLTSKPIPTTTHTKASVDAATYLSREGELAETLPEAIHALPRPDIDAIAVTTGPGLEPALWVGINTARYLSAIWQIPIIPTNHMAGHIESTRIDPESPLVGVQQMRDIPLPACALLVSGGHTELIHIASWGDYEKLGETRDDAAGEAFDKVARMLDLPYPGGPALSQLAATCTDTHAITFPRPMQHSDELAFSFSGLKTAVRYAIEKEQPLSNSLRCAIAYAFETAVIDSLATKTVQAINRYTPKSLLVAGGVSANTVLQDRCATISKEYDIPVYMPRTDLTGDNAIMIGLAGYTARAHGTTELATIIADGSISL